MDQYIRPLKPFTPVPDDRNDILDYTAGVIDTDGTIGTNADSDGNVSLIVSVTQAVKGYGLIEFFYNTFGGAVNKHMDATETTQASYMWVLCGNDNIVAFLRNIEKRMTVKRREALAAIEFPCQHTHIIPIIAINIKTDEEKEFDTVKDVASFFGMQRLTIPKDDVKMIRDEWIVKKLLDSNEVKKIKEKRLEIRKQLKTFHSSPHDEIPTSFTPSNAYVAGVIDGEGCLDTHGKSSQHHSVSQKSKPLLQLLQNKYGGTICPSNRDNFEWSIFSCDNAENLLKDIQPYIQGKKQQVDLILSMKPGEAGAIHAQLREMKGNYTHTTTRIDKINGGRHVKDYKLPVKELPVGVHKCYDRYQALLGVDKTQYCLGVFDTVDEAEAQYKKYKKLAQNEIRTGEKQVDWGKLFRRDEKLNALVLPEPIDHKEPNIWTTPFRTYQVKIRNKPYGTYRTLEEAIIVRDETLAKIRTDELNAKLTSKNNIYPRESKGRGLVFDVKIGGKSYGAYDSEEEAIEVRNKVILDIENKKQLKSTPNV